MRSAVLICRTLSLVALALSPLSVSQQARAGEDGFTDIFNGKDLTDWVVEGQAKYREKGGGEEQPTWTVEEGMLVCAPGAGFGFVRYDQQKYGDFALRLEYRMSKNCNSGVGIRTPPFTGDINTRPSHAAYEVQILDDFGKKPNKTSHGSLYNFVAPTSNESKSTDEWQVMDIECRGPKIKVTLNGKVVQDFDQSTNPDLKDKPLSGYVSLQNHGRKIEFRAVQIKDLSAVGEK